MLSVSFVARTSWSSWPRLLASIDARVLETARKAAAAQGRTFEAPFVSVEKAVEGLGLKLERRRALIVVIVVDSLDRAPTDN